MTAYERIAAHLERYGSITTAEGYELYGNLRVAASKFNLKRKGYPIVTYTENGVNRYGKRTNYARYYLKGANGSGSTMDKTCDRLV